MLGPLTLKPEAFGLDISDLSLKLIKLKKRGKFFGLSSFSEVEIPPGLIKEGKIENEEKLVKIIKKVIKEVKGDQLKTKYVVASLPEEKAFLQVIQMPRMTKEELAKAVPFQAENYVPLAIEKVYLDFQVVPPVFDHLDHLNVLIAALPKKTVDPYFSLLKKAGLKPLALEIESQAISRALVEKGVSSEPLLLLDIGATRISFMIFSGYSLRFTSSIPVSSQKFTEIISKNLKVDLEQAEKLKIKKGIQASKRDNKIFEILIPALTDLTEQIKKYLSYYQTHAFHEHLPPDGKVVKKAFLCGGGANLKGLADFLSSELKLQVELGNPWTNILPRPLKEVPELSYPESLKYTTALGLALRGLKYD